MTPPPNSAFFKAPTCPKNWGHLNRMSIQSKMEALGGLHDAMVMSLAWSAEDRALSIVVDDINANTRGFPEYPGRSTAKFVLSGVTLLEAQAELGLDGLTIFEWIISEKGPDGYRSSISLSPGGRLVIECGRIDITPA